MTPQQIKHIIQVVVDYGWPTQVICIQPDGSYTWEPIDDMDQLLWCLRIESDISKAPVRLDPTHEWNWPIETREGMPCWALEPGHNAVLWFPAYVKEPYIVYPDGSTAWSGPGHHNDWHIGVLQCVAPHPLKPNEPPPADWTPEGKRVLK